MADLAATMMCDMFIAPSDALKARAEFIDRVMQVSHRCSAVASNLSDEHKSMIRRMAGFVEKLGMVFVETGQCTTTEELNELRTEVLSDLELKYRLSTARDHQQIARAGHEHHGMVIERHGPEKNGGATLS